FYQPGKPRTKMETIQTLKTQFVLAETQGTTKVKEARTETGIKDTYQKFFTDR
ncbi:MAG: hypothetical protein NXY57DRAFT_878087, partial [Lentinula lateritia]